MPFAPDDDVIVDRDPQQPSGFGDPAGYLDVRAAGFC